MNYKYLLHLNSLNFKEAYPCNFFKIILYDKRKQTLVLQRTQFEGTESNEVDVHVFLKQISSFDRIYVQNLDVLDRDVIENFVINRTLSLQRTAVKECSYKSKYDFESVSIIENDYNLIIHKEHRYKYTIKIGNLLNFYLECDKDIDKTLKCVLKSIKRKVRDTEGLYCLEVQEKKWLKKILKEELQNLSINSLEKEEKYEEKSRSDL